MDHPMKNSFVVMMAVALLALPVSAAERLRMRPGAENLEYLQKNRAATLVQWEHPRYPPEPNADWVERAVRIAFEIDAEGNVVDPRVMGGAEEYAAVALEAVSRWKFKPETVDGQPALVSKEVRLVFTPKGTPKKTVNDRFLPPFEIEDPQLTPPGEPASTEGSYPTPLLVRRLSGEVEMMLGVDLEGKVEGVEILRSSHPEFLGAALQTVAGWKLRPARRGRIPQPGLKRAVMTFQSVDDEGRLMRVDWLEHNGIVLREPVGARTSGHFDHTPDAAVMVDPVYPQPLLLAGTQGEARVHFRVTPEGQVTHVVIQEATAPEFGESLAAAIASWQFQPLQKEGKDCWADFSMGWRFALVRPDSTEQRLLDSRETDQKPVNPRQLDRPLVPLFIRQAVYPAALRETGEGGEAEIEVIIDREGRVRLPHIRSASHPAFGWAAATAVSQWWFETPLKGGGAVDVRVVVPVQFKAPVPE
jgi:TonB family protein